MGRPNSAGSPGLTPLVAYREWITSTARRLGSSLP
jgi:hypothetical protein